MRPVATEKAVMLVESQNVITLKVDKRKSKDLIKKEVEEYMETKELREKFRLFKESLDKPYYEITSDEKKLIREISTINVIDFIMDVGIFKEDMAIISNLNVFDDDVIDDLTDCIQEDIINTDL